MNIRSWQNLKGTLSYLSGLTVHPDLKSIESPFFLYHEMPNDNWVGIVQVDRTKIIIKMLSCQLTQQMTRDD
jgi:hypothetical protein